MTEEKTINEQIDEQLCKIQDDLNKIKWIGSCVSRHDEELSTDVGDMIVDYIKKIAGQLDSLEGFIYPNLKEGA